MKQVLIAEDSESQRRLLVHALNKTDDTIHIHEAADGEEAIDILKSAAIDLVVTDINMPRVNGLMVIAYLNAFLPDIPCFVVTAYATSRLKSKMPPDLLRLYQKPLKPFDVARAIAAALDRRDPESTCRALSAVSFLQLVSQEQATCTITISSELMPTCTLYLEKGILLDAVAGDRRGESAAIDALSRPDINYCIDDGIPTEVEKRMDVSLADLLRNVSDCLDKP